MKMSYFDKLVLIDLGILKIWEKLCRIRYLKYDWLA